MESIIDKSKELFFKMINDYGSDPYNLSSHLEQAEKWVKFMLKKYLIVDKEILMISLWLHDIGHYPIDKNIDHAIKGEMIAKEFLEKNNMNKNKIIKILHCIRAHRCKDIVPETIEAKIIAFSDSASHMTDTLYLAMAKKGSFDIKTILEKLERDYRDISIFPEMTQELKPLYESWKKLLEAYDNLKNS